jgi:hypothetical protein
MVGNPNVGYPNNLDQRATLMTPLTHTPAPAVLRARLDDLADHQALIDLPSRLGAWLDDQRFDETGDLFVPEASVSTPGGTAHGAEALAAQARRNHVGARTQHAITNVLVDRDGDRARLRANLVVTFAAAAVPAGLPAPTKTLGERYDLDAVRTRDGWRLARVAIAPVWAREG